MTDGQVAAWTLLTNHTHVLCSVNRPPARMRDLAAACQISERDAQAIVADLEQAGYLSRERVGRRTHYTLDLDGTLRRPAEANTPIRTLLEVLAHHHGGQTSHDRAPNRLGK
ncbi:helix-turn-helix transcriptional regulator [Streptomyces violens]|uniref:helix-turn-helix transcriptional regulator n=1 Tax=Streptomyces violens TaxID=66377 RepID=UPI00068E0F5E|nr:hypothetical protein [Streptomyces violens]